MTNFATPKQLKVKKLVDKSEFHPGGFIFQIIDNDGTTVLKEYWEANDKLGIQFCRNWLKTRAGEEIDFSSYIKEQKNAEPDKVG